MTPPEIPEHAAEQEAEQQLAAQVPTGTYARRRALAALLTLLAKEGS